MRPCNVIDQTSSKKKERKKDLNSFWTKEVGHMPRKLDEKS